MKRFNKAELQALAAIAATAVQQILRIVVYTCRAVRADDPELLSASLTAADAATQSLCEIGAAIIDSAE